MSAGRPLPVTAPRGKEFAVSRLTHVTDDAQVRVSPARWLTLSDAEKAARGIDWRLAPTIVLIEKAAS